MIHNEAEFQQTLDQLGRMQHMLGDLRQRILPVNPKMFALMAEGPLEHMRQFYQELEDYRASLLPADQPIAASTV